MAIFRKSFRKKASVSLSQRCFGFGPRHVVVGQEAGVRGQGVVSEDRVVVGGARAGGVLTRRGVLLERRGQVQVLIRNRKQHSVQFLHQLLERRPLSGNGVPALTHQHV